MKKVVIAGGGISGLACNYVFSQYRNVDVKVLEPVQPGGEFLAGGLKYIHRTDEVVSMFTDLGMVFSNYSVRGGIMLRGKVEQYPKCFEGMDRAEAHRIQADHYRKTRLSEPGKHSRRAMNDPASVKPRRALRCDFESMITALAARAVIVPTGLQKVGVKILYLADGSILPYDYLVLTIPLWVIRRCVDWYVPHGVAMRLNVINVQPRKDRYARWDYVYTPYTPENTIHRFSVHGSGYAMEANGDLDHNKLHGDLNFIFSGGWWIGNIKAGLKGHLLPLDQEAQWPDNVAPLGRFAKWDSRATMDVVLADSIGLAERWLR